MSTKNTPHGSTAGYLLPGQAGELERHRLQSRVWEPSGRRLLGESGGGQGARSVHLARRRRDRSPAAGPAGLLIFGLTIVKTFGAVVTAAVLSAAVAAPASAHRPATSPRVALDWNRTAVATLAASGKPQTESMIYMGLTQAAVYDAVTAIEGRFEPYRIRPGVPPHASAEAAAVAAAHGVLSAYFPAQRPALDAAYAASLSGIPDGSGEDRGVLVGQQVASGIVAARIDDGRDAPAPPAPAADPGVWRPTPPGFLAPQTPWVANVTPLLLRRTSQFRPGPPPRRTSPMLRR